MGQHQQAGDFHIIGIDRHLAAQCGMRLCRAQREQGRAQAVDAELCGDPGQLFTQIIGNSDMAQMGDRGGGVESIGQGGLCHADI